MPADTLDGEMPEPVSAQPADPDRQGGSELEGWLARLGLRAPEPHLRSEGLFHQSKALYALARQVSMSTPSPEDSAQLLRKAIYQLFAAVLRLEGGDVTSYHECRERIAASAEYRELFADVVEDLPLLEELLASFALVGDDREGLGQRYTALMGRMPTAHKKVRRYLDARLRAAGGRPMLGRVLVAAALVGAAVVAFLLVIQQLVPTESAEGGEPQAGTEAMGSEPAVPPEAQTDATKCFTGQYFTGVEFDRLVHTRRDCQIDFDWGDGSVDGLVGIEVDHFSVRWEGTLQVPETEIYVFYLASDDGSRLYLEGGQIVGEWTDHGLGETASKPVELDQGVGYPIRVEYFEKTELAQVRLMWSSNTMSKRLLSGHHITPKAQKGVATETGE